MDSDATLAEQIIEGFNTRETDLHVPAYPEVTLQIFLIFVYIL